MLDQSISMLRQQLIDRIRPNSSFAEDLKANVHAAFGILDRFEADRDRINRDTKLSDEGRRAEVAELVRATYAPKLASGPARRARYGSARLASQRKAVGKPTFDKTDMAAGLERSEVRSFLREQPEGKRVTVAFEFAKDKKLAQALLSSPSIRITGLTPEVFQQVHEAYLEHHHSDEIGEIDAHLADIEALTSAVQLVSTKLAGASGMTETEFKQFWAVQEKAADR